MYKLVCIAGKLRGQEYELSDSENVVGREGVCNVMIPIEGVSKKHFSITVTNDVAYLKDLDSVNGTFVNGKMVKAITVKDKDKIAIPDCIFLIVYVKEIKKIIKKVVTRDDAGLDGSFLDPKETPQNIVQKIMFLFKYKIMPVFHGINEEYEWKSLVAIMLSIFIIMTIALTIYPVLQDSKNLLIFETQLRGQHYAKIIAETNAKALEQKDLDNIDVNFLKDEEGIAYYELFDMDGRIIRPTSKLNTYITDNFSIAAREWVIRSKQNPNSNDRVFRKKLDEGKIGIAYKIDAFDAKKNIYDTVGVIAIQFAPLSLTIEAVKNSVAYLEALSTSALIAVLFFGIVYYLTIRPVDEITFQVDQALRGRRKEIEPTLLFGELRPLTNMLNNMISRIREYESAGTDSEFADLEEDTRYVSQLIEFMSGSGVPTMVLNSEKLLQKINLEAEDLTGIRESSAFGQSLLDVAREKGFAATIIELCDNSGDNSGMSHSGSYEIGGYQYKIYVTSLIGKDNFAKAFYITFIKDE